MTGIGPLRGKSSGSAPISQPLGAVLDGGSSQKYERVYRSRTASPSSHAPMNAFASPAAELGSRSATTSLACAAIRGASMPLGLPGSAHPTTVSATIAAFPLADHLPVRCADI